MERVVLRFIAIITLSACLFGTPARAVEPDAALLDAVVRIDVVRDAAGTFRRRPVPKEGVGAGVILDRGGVLTMAHVVFGARDITVTMRDGAQRRAAIAAIDADADIALLAVPTPLPRGLTLRWRPITGERVTAIGHPRGFPDWTAVSGKIESVHMISNGVERGGIMIPLLLLDARGDQGMSGGPVLDADGRIIGVVTRSLTGTQRLLAVPAREACFALIACR